MKKFLVAACAIGAALLTSACADDSYNRHGSMAVAYSGYYDDAYGPFYDGYWGGDEGHGYSAMTGQQVSRDEAHHFRHDHFNGYHAVQGHRHDSGHGDWDRHDGDHR